MLCCGYRKKKNAKIHVKRKLSIEMVEEYWTEFLLPSHIITAQHDKMYDILEYREEELIGKDFRPILHSPIMF